MGAWINGPTGTETLTLTTRFSPPFSPMTLGTRLPSNSTCHPLGSVFSISSVTLACSSLSGLAMIIGRLGDGALAGDHIEEVMLGHIVAGVDVVLSVGDESQRARRSGRSR